MASLGTRVLSGLRSFLGSRRMEGGDDAAGSAAGAATDSMSDSEASTNGTASASVTPGGSPRNTPVVSPALEPQPASMMPPFAPPPDDEPPAARTARERAELKAALLHLHGVMVATDTADARVFLEPVNAAFALFYYEVISRPIDLGLIGRRIEADHYPTAWEYMDDFQLMISNCLEYNKPGSFHSRYGQKFLRLWQRKVEDMVVKTLKHHDYCCGRRRVLSRFAYRCRGGTCFVRYGCVYWAFNPGDGDDDVVYCHAHWQQLPPQTTIPRFGNGTGGDITFSKERLKRARNKTPLVHENFVTCVECGHRDHEICKMHQTWACPAYHCDRCRRRFGIEALPAPSPWSLPSCHLSKALEAEVAGKVPEFGGTVCIRVVDHERERGELKPRMRARFPEHPTEFPYAKKVVVCFLNVDDDRPVCFFGMILHEYGEDCPEPNKGRCYLSLLDSVKMPKALLPSAARTAIYHAVVRGYMREAGRRGFKACHIYTCPPRKGQNYIFPFKPEDQREISTQRLRKWYADVLKESATCDPPAVLGYRNIADAFPTAGLTDVPYFDGDNWPDLLEDIIKHDEKMKEEGQAGGAEGGRVVTPDGAAAGGVGGTSSGGSAAPAAPAAVDAASGGCSGGARKHPRASEPKPGHPGAAHAPAPPPKKRRKSESKRAPPKKPALSAEGRLRAVMTASRRDFLVVELVRPHASRSGVSVDPDAAVALAKTGKNHEGEEHSVSSFLRSEKLEFSTLRHAKFSTMLLLHALLSESLPPERYPDAKAEEARWAAEAAAAEAVIAAAEAKAIAEAERQRALAMAAADEADGETGPGGRKRRSPRRSVSVSSAPSPATPAPPAAGQDGGPMEVEAR